MFDLICSGEGCNEVLGSSSIENLKGHLCEDCSKKRAEARKKTEEEKLAFEKWKAEQEAKLFEEYQAAK